MQDVRPGGLPTTKSAKTPAAKPMGRFQCEALLQSEGLLETWRARVGGLAGFDRVFSVKCLVAGALTRRPRAAEDLLRTARAVAALKDARIATVMDSGLAPGSAFVATEYIHGVSLRALREYVHGRAAEEGGRPQSWPAVLVHLCAEIAGALAAAHGADSPLTHGALAAGSVMVTPQGGIKLVDLGLFASVHTPAEIAASPVRRPCAAPELSRGQAPGPASDMYALGSLALELATGRERRASGKLDSGISWSRALATELQTLIRRLLSFDVAERPTAAMAEVALREAAALVRGIDQRGELGLLVRRVLQSSGEPGARDGDELAIEEPAPPGTAAGSSALETTEQVFGDEPTQVLPVSKDGNPDELAGILRGMRRQPEDDEGTVIDGRRGHATPAHPLPATAADGNNDEVAWPSEPQDDATALAESAAETRVQGLPSADLVEVAQPRIQRVSIKEAAAPRPAAQLASPAQPLSPAHRFEEFSADHPHPAQMTPSGWHPAGDLDGPTETDFRPLTEEVPPVQRRPEPPRRRRRRTLGRLSRAALVLVVAAVFGAGLAATVRFVAGKPPATVSGGRAPR